MHSISHWGLIEWPKDRGPRVGEIGSYSHPYALLAKELWGIDGWQKWHDLERISQKAGVRIILRT